MIKEIGSIIDLLAVGYLPKIQDIICSSLSRGVGDCRGISLSATLRVDVQSVFY